MVPTDELVAAKRNARSHSHQQIGQIARSIERFGLVNPILIDHANQIVAGHGRVEAAKWLGLEQVPVLRVTHLSAAERRAYALVDNRLAELSGWDDEILAIELQELRELDFTLADIGFQLDDVDIISNEPEKIGDQSAAPKTDRAAGTSNRTISRAGDLWLLGPHQLQCSDGGDDSYAAVDAAIRRWQRVTGQPAMLAASGKSFAAVVKERAGTAAKVRAPRQAAGKQEAA
jgi:ParB-like chromosome segregation protein Spo0J